MIARLIYRHKNRIFARRLICRWLLTASKESVRRYINRLIWS